MRRSITPTDLQRELAELRARAYGPNPDIEEDPAALARLIELEARPYEDTTARGEIDSGAVDSTPDADAADSSQPTAGPADAAPGSRVHGDDEQAVVESDAPRGVRWRHADAARWGRIGLGIGAGLAVLAIASGVGRLVGPHPDATLYPSGREPSVYFAAEGVHQEFDVSTYESFDTFRGIEPWTVVGEFGNPCLILVDRSTQTTLGAECTPPEGELRTDIGVWPTAPKHVYGAGLPDGSVIRFILRGSAVEAFIIRASDAG